MRRKVEVPDNNIITPDVVIPDSGDLAPQAPTKAEINYSFDFNIGDRVTCLLTSNEEVSGVVSFVTENNVWLKPTSYASMGKVVSKNQILYVKLGGKAEDVKEDQFLREGVGYLFKMVGGSAFNGMLTKLGSDWCLLANGAVVKLANVIYIS